MPKDYYKAAIVIFTVQLLLLAVLVNGIIIEKFGAFPYPRLGDSALILGVLVFILTIASIFVIRNLYVNSQRIYLHKLDTLRFNHIEGQNRIYQQHRHDLHNHMTVISGLAQLGKVDRLKEYLSSYLDNFDESIVSISTGLKELDILFTVKVVEARNREIDVSYQCLANVECNREQIIGLTALLANAVDNAIQASDNSQHAKRLDIKITEDLVDYTFEISNTYDTDIDLENLLSVEGFTTKQGSSRGEGVSIIRKTVKHFRGTLNYRINDGHCLLIIELPKLSLEGSM